MKIYILPVAAYLKPPTQGFIWPPGCDDYGVEQDFLHWLEARPDLLAGDPEAADWHYLPIYWNRWYWTVEDEPRQNSPTFQAHLDRALLDPGRTFTVCEYDPYGLQPGIELGGLTVFSGNRMTPDVIDIPLLLHPHTLPSRDIRRRAVFIGQMSTHPLRAEMQEALVDCPGCLVTGQPHGIQDFVRELRASLVALAPRGDGAQSFRFYEAMQAGVVPLYISDLDARPFKEHIDWDAVSLYRDTADGLCEFLYSHDPGELRAMGERAFKVYRDQLAYGQWCKYVIEELNHVG